MPIEDVTSLPSLKPSLYATEELAQARPKGSSVMAIRMSFGPEQSFRQGPSNPSIDAFGVMKKGTASQAKVELKRRKVKALGLDSRTKHLIAF
ncbi:MAG: hypothetical protein QW520_00375 [Methanomassiliicoccales archaeon]